MKNLAAEHNKDDSYSIFLLNMLDFWPLEYSATEI